MPNTYLVVLLGAALLPTPTARAQAPTHQIPERGAAVYERKFERETTVVLPNPETLPNQYVNEVPENPGAAVVLHSDLDSKGRRIGREPEQLLDIATYVACDLTTLGKKKFAFDVTEIRPFGKLRVEGVIAPDQDGAERIRVELRSAPLAKGAAPPPATLTAQLQIVRKFDASQGIVTRIDSTCSGEIEFPNRTRADEIRRAAFTVRDSWQLREVIGNREQKFRDRVNAAIQKGAADLKKILSGDYAQRFAAAPAQDGQTRQSGELALILLTLLKAGETQFDPIVKAALDDLRQRHITDTYSLGVALLTIEACYTPASERDDLLSGRLSAPHARQPTPADKATIERWVEQLLINRTDADRDGSTRWHYLPSPDFDNSCSQYGLLGLYAAHLCGVEVDRAVWIGAVRHFLRMQSEPVAKVRFGLTTHQQVEENKTGRRTQSATEACGWSYRGRDGELTGSMTTAGIGSLTICDAALGGRSRPGDVSGVKVRGAIKSGFAWLAEHYDARRNPGAPMSWRHYYLYGLERACELNQIAWIENRDWYFDGATLLLEEQQPNGRWGGEVETCFAILFLKKAALPVLTGGR